MELPADIRPDDRVLALGIPDPDIVAALSRSVPEGLVVAIGEGDAVRAARKAAIDLPNVMFVPGDPGDIPWNDGFFTRVIDLHESWPDADRVRREVERVTRPPQATRGADHG